MSSNQNIQPASEMNEADDLLAFIGHQFSDDLCQRCGRHLAVAGAGICTLCMAAEDSERHELSMFDPELADNLAGLGDTWAW